MNYTPLRRYYRGDELVAMRDVPAGTTRYYHFDHQGTTQALTDSTGAVTDRFAADAWGVEVKRTGSSINRQWYVGNAGYYRQADSILDYIRARYYAAASGRWASRDPLQETLGPYVYCDSASSLKVDPTGWQAPSSGSSVLLSVGICMLDKSCRAAIGPDGYKDPCKWARQILKRDIERAGVPISFIFCCKGEPFVCLNDPEIPPGTPPGVIECLKRHERAHLPHADCQAGDLQLAAPKDISRDESECIAYKAELRCYKDSSPNACKNKNQSPRQIEKCLEQYRSFCIEACRLTAAHCGSGVDLSRCISDCRKWFPIPKK